MSKEIRVVNSLYSYLETYYVVARHIERALDLMLMEAEGITGEVIPCPVLQEIVDEEGYLGFTGKSRLAIELTNKFEDKHRNTEWDVDANYLDEMSKFIDENLYPKGFFVFSSYEMFPT